MEDLKLDTAISGEVIPVSPEAEVMRALQYIMLRETKKSMIEIASEFGYTTREGMYKLVERWKAKGIYDKANQHYLLMKTTEVEAATAYVLEQWPRILIRISNIALFGKDHVALEAAAWLKATVVDPALAQKQDEANAEKRWAEKAGDFNSEVVVPAHLLKAAKEGT